jgi:Cu+-exporting ATPase
VKGAGYDAMVRVETGTSADLASEDAQRAAQRKHTEHQQHLLILSAFLAIHAFLISMVPPFMTVIPTGVAEWLASTFGGSWDPMMVRVPGVRVITPVQFYAGAQFYRGRHALNATGNMDTLIAIGTSAAYFTASATLFRAQPSLSSTRRHCHRVRDPRRCSSPRAGQDEHAIKKLMGLAPIGTSRARRVEADILVEQVVAGDIKWSARDKIPVDGRSSRAAAGWMSRCSRESRFRSRRTRDSVIGATLNKLGSFKFRATKVGAILHWLRSSLSRTPRLQSPIQRFADRISAVFVPAVVVFRSHVPHGLFVVPNFTIPRSTPRSHRS